MGLTWGCDCGFLVVSCARSGRRWRFGVTLLLVRGVVIRVEIRNLGVLSLWKCLWCGWVERHCLASRVTVVVHLFIERLAVLYVEAACHGCSVKNSFVHGRELSVADPSPDISFYFTILVPYMY